MGEPPGPGGQTPLALELGLIAVLILLNGFFAGAEIAVISARRGRIQALAQAGHRGAAALVRLKADPDRFLATVQIGVTVVGTLASAVGGVAAVQRLQPMLATLPFPWLAAIAEPAAVVLVVCAISYLSLVVGELVPKSLAVRHADTLALAVARPIFVLSQASGLLVAFLTRSTRLVLAAFGQSDRVENPFHTLDDLKGFVDEAQAQGLISGDVVRGAFEVQRREARELMTPRPRMAAVPRHATFAEALRIATDSGYSRLPVYDLDTANVVGLLHARDLLAPGRAQDSGIEELIRPVLTATPPTTGLALLKRMQQERVHLAVVVDEHGATLGLVTMEDVLEAIVGEIRDERDAESEPARQLRPGVWEVEAAVSLEEMRERYGIALPSGEGFVTLAGLVLDRRGALPAVGDELIIPPYRLQVLRLEGARIARVRIEALAGDGVGASAVPVETPRSR